MGVSTDGIIGYGVVFDEDYEFPWDAEKYDGDIEEWWMVQTNYEPPFCPYTDDGGDYKPGINSESPEVSVWHTSRRDWIERNPVPVELVNYCSGDYPMIAVCVPGSVISCRRGCPLAFDTRDLKVTTDQHNDLEFFLDEYGLVPDEGAQWYLMSFWG